MNKKIIKFNTYGKILTGKYRDWYVYVKDESLDDSGYTLFLISSKDDKKPREGYDCWYYNYEELEINFLDYCPNVKWEKI